MSEPLVPGLSHANCYETLPEFLTPEEFARCIRVSRNTMYELLRRGEIAHVRYGRLIRIPKSALLIAQKNA
jgi:excisionase family DNA binding protein